MKTSHTKTHEGWYETNKKYSTFLDGQSYESYRKYVDAIAMRAQPQSRILDVGCGTGLVVSALVKLGFKWSYGIEISQTSVNVCKRKKLRCSYYDGNTIPFAIGHFDVVGSFNVLEHTDNPVRFLNEKYRVLKKGGYMIVVCPNFLSTTNNYHHNTRGIFRKILNAISLTIKILTNKASFKKMTPIDNAVFYPDDDAINETNPLDIEAWARSKKLKQVYWSARQVDGGVFQLIDRGPLRMVLGACFMVYQK